jgi:hypothetical protein
MRVFLLIGLLFTVLVMASCASAPEVTREPGLCPYIVVPISQAMEDQFEADPGRALYGAIKSRPECKVVAVEYVGWSDVGLGQESKRLIFDSVDNILIDLSHIAVEVGNTYESWRIWYDVTPADFKEGIPDKRVVLRMKESPAGDPMGALRKEYNGPPEVIIWQ